MTNVLDPRLLLQGYAAGIFPMADSRDAADIFWVEPRQRAILPLDGFHCSRSLRRRLRSGRFTVTRDTAFDDGRPRLRRPRRDVDQRRHRASHAQPPRRGPRPFDRMLARRRHSSAASTGSSSAAPSSANRCSAAAPTPRRSRSPGSSRGSGSAISPCSTASSSPTISPRSGATQLSRSAYVALLGAALGSGSGGASLPGGVSLGRRRRGRRCAATRCRRPTSARSTGCSRPKAWPARRARRAS